jgi:hypothetical protein
METLSIPWKNLESFLCKISSTRPLGSCTLFSGSFLFPLSFHSPPHLALSPQSEACQSPTHVMVVFPFCFSFYTPLYFACHPCYSPDLPVLVVGQNATVSLISLCPSGKNKRPILAPPPPLSLSLSLSLSLVCSTLLPQPVTLSLLSVLWFLCCVLTY